MKICIDSRMYSYPGGIARYIRSLINQYTNDINNDYLLIGNEKKMKKFDKIKTAKNISTTNFKVSSSLGETSSTISKIKNRVMEQINYPIKDINDCDIFHAPNFNFPLFYNGPLVVTIHDLTLLKFSDLLLPNKMAYIYIKYMIKKAVEKSDMIITVSNNTKKDIVDWFDISEDKIKVIYNGIDEKFKKIENKNKIKEFKNKHDINSDYILSLGNIKPHKNLKRLIKAFAKVQNHNNDIKLVITGKGEVLLDELREIIKKNDIENKVIFTGFLEDEELPLIYNAAELLIYPSLYEGFGIPPLEAMACGTPVVTSNKSSLPEVVGEAAILVDPYKIDDIADGILEVLNNKDLAKNLINKGYKRIQKFTWEKAAQETLEVYESVKAK